MKNMDMNEKKSKNKSINYPYFIKISPNSEQHYSDKSETSTSTASNPQKAQKQNKSTIKSPSAQSPPSLTTADKFSDQHPYAIIYYKTTQRII